MLAIPRLGGTFDLDGKIDEPGWDQALKLTLVQSKPDFGAEPSERTEVLVGYTDDYLYAACRCYDRGTRVAPSFKRDHAAWADAFSIVLDTFNDNENALGFYTTPTGLRLDVAVSNDAAGDSPLDLSWNTFWDVEVLQNENGWFAEMRIPISSLRFQVDDGQVSMGLSAMRFLPRNNEIAVFPAIPPQWGTFSHMKPSQAQDVVFPDLEPQTPLRVTPYVLAGLGQQRVLDPAQTAYRVEREPAYDAGLDIKYGLTSNLTLDLTVNTDFAQVEADNREVNLTRFPLFFPEKRRFFLERSSNLAFDFGGPNRLFYSRRIGLHEGQQVRILGGARLVGRAGPWDVGVMSMQTAEEADLGADAATLPSENFAVARFRRRVVNQYSYVGGIVTSRSGADGTYNRAYGLDGIFRISSDDYVSLKWAQTFDDRFAGRLASLDPARIQVQWERRRYEGLGYSFSYARAGELYEPGLGFELREDYFKLGDRVTYGWLPGEESIFQSQRISLVGDGFFRNADGSLESLTLGPEWEMETNRGHSLAVAARRREEDLRNPFALSDEVEIPAGRHAFHEAEVSYSTPQGRTLRGTVELAGGDFFDGQRRSIGLRPQWNASRYVQMSGAYQFDRIRFPDRPEAGASALTSHIGRLRLEVTPSVRYAASGFLQYSSLGDVVLGNVRLRYNPREGTDLYLVYNERLNTDRFGVDPHLPLSSSRTLLLKYTYTPHW